MPEVPVVLLGELVLERSHVHTVDLVDAEYIETILRCIMDIVPMDKTVQDI
jgi:hypothetical protein